MSTENSPYSDEQRKEAVRCYLVTGECEAATKLCGVPAQTINHWKLHATWWDEVSLEVCLELEEKYRAGWRGALSGALDIMQDRLAHGNVAVHLGKPVYETNEAGEKVAVRVPIPAKDAIVIGAIAQDKLRLSLGLPSRIVAREADDDRLSRLRKVAEEDRRARGLTESPAEAPAKPH